MKKMFYYLISVLCICAFFRAANGAEYVSVGVLFDYLSEFELSFEPYWEQIHAASTQPFWNPPAGLEFFAYIKYAFTFVSDYMTFAWGYFLDGLGAGYYYLDAFFGIIKSIFQLVLKFCFGI